MDKTLFNGSGYKDDTAYAAILNVQKAEKKRLIANLKELAEKRGYRIVGVINLANIIA